MNKENKMETKQILKEKKIESHMNFKGMVESARKVDLESIVLAVNPEFNRNKIYMAGKLFSEADQTQRRIEYERLKKVNNQYGIDKDIFSPIFADINDKSNLPTDLDIFNADESELMSSDVIFADLSDGDEGVLMELGMVLLTDVKIYSYISDIRIPSAGEYDGIKVPFGYNQFVIGGLEKYHGKVHLGFDEALKAYIEDHK